MDTLDNYKSALGSYLGLNADRFSLYWKGRVGLYAIFRALGIEEGDEILLPGYTCVVVPNAIIYCGARPVYIDIDPATFNIDLNQIAAKITNKTKAILIQSTFGLSPDIDAIKSIVAPHGLKIIEDNTHSFGASYRGTPSGLLGDAAFFSSQWNKPFSTGIGGFVLANDPQLLSALQKLETSLPTPPASAARMLQLQLRFRQQLTSSRWYWPAVKAYRWLSQKNFINGSSSGEELVGTEMPQDYWMGMSEVQAKEGVKQLARFPDNLKHRRKLADYYQQALPEMGIAPVYEPNYAKHIFLKYPFFVKDKARFLQLAHDARIRLGEWLASPIHPIVIDWEKWQYFSGTCPVAEKLSQHILNLPTDPDFSLADAQRMVQFLQKNRQELIADPKTLLS